MKRILVLFMVIAISLTGCQSAASGETIEGDETIRIGYITERLGDNAMNDDTYDGMKQFSDETGIEFTLIEAPELQDHEINARNFCEDGYDLVVCSSSTSSELLAQVAGEYPDTHFIICEGTVTDHPNVTYLRFTINEAGFLTGAFNTLMNEHLGGGKRAAFIGGMRNPNLERSQFGFTAGCEYVGGECTVSYLGNFTDVAKAKEISLQLFNQDIKLIQAFAGGGSMGVFQAAESMGDGYYALGGANGQFHMSDSIIASQVKYQGKALYQALNMYLDGTLESGNLEGGLLEEIVGIRYAPDHEAEIPEEIIKQIEELEAKILSGEIKTPSTEEEYAEFTAAYLD